jgi:hypothetical protein
MIIADLIRALQQGGDPNAAILAGAQAPAMSPAVSTALGAAATNTNLNTDAAVAEEEAKRRAAAAVTDAGLDPRPNIPNVPIPTPRPQPPPPPTTTPEGIKTPITNPAPAAASPRMMQSPPDLANMYIELVRKNQNAAALDSGLSTIAAGLSKYPENRAALLRGASDRSGQQQLTSADIINLQKMQVENQALMIRQAAKGGLMKKYNLDRDTIDYLDASGKLDEVIQHHNTQNLTHVVHSDGSTAFYDQRSGKKVIDTSAPKASDDQKALDAVNAGRVAKGEAPIDMETFITTVKRDKPQEPNATDKAALEQINEERKAKGLPPADMETYVTTIKRDPQQPANAADVQTLLQINMERKAKGEAPITMEEYQKKVKREPRAAADEADRLALEAINADRKAEGRPPMTREHYITKVKRQGVTVNVGPQGQQFPTPPQGQDYVRNEDGTIKVGDDGKPTLYTVAGAQPTTIDLAKKEREETEAQRKVNKAKIQQTMASNNVSNAVDTALEHVDKLGVVGFGSDVSRSRLLPAGRAPHIFDSAVSTINANSAISALQAMREASPHGGALGNVTDFENRMLSATTAALDKFADPATITKNLIRIKAMFITLNEQRYDDKADPEAPAKFERALKENIDELSVAHMNKKKSAGQSKIERVKP